VNETTLPKQEVTAVDAQLDYAKRALEEGDFALARARLQKLTAGASQNDRQKVNAFIRNLRIDPVAIVVALVVAICLAVIAGVTLFH
jgi:hypothetical protein